jgi:bacterioferritin-associated ferredoxin
MYVCLCKAITDKQIHEAIDNGVQTIAQLQESCGATTGCGRCLDVAQELLNERLEDSAYYAA